MFSNLTSSQHNNLINVALLMISDPRGIAPRRSTVYLEYLPIVQVVFGRLKHLEAQTIINSGDASLAMKALLFIRRHQSFRVNMTAANLAEAIQAVCVARRSGGLYAHRAILSVEIYPRTRLKIGPDTVVGIYKDSVHAELADAYANFLSSDQIKTIQVLGY
ncbi:hypothetical protein [Pseudomonas sp. D2002]|uniref:hypothetical protein n=1 Tax=Pseudomonas sp. D2002 TaxID=2726980 RepID=UPI0015A0036F|nr:hypothetical protein [Pseudomonas sp. D2002]NWA81613.1 hypothetical protein [Pseudomonas sp. D2002]